MLLTNKDFKLESLTDKEKETILKWFIHEYKGFCNLRKYDYKTLLNRHILSFDPEKINKGLKETGESYFGLSIFKMLPYYNNEPVE